MTEFGENSISNLNKVVRAERRLLASLEVLQGGLAVFDKRDKLIAANKAWMSLFPRGAHFLPGSSYLDMLQAVVRYKLVDLHGQDATLWLADMMVRRRAEYIEDTMLLLNTGTWIKLIDRRNSDGDIVSMAIDQSDRIKQTEALEVARKHAEAANETKVRFLSNMSHELRTPLNAISGMSEVLKAGNLNGEQRDCLETIQDSTRKLVQLINDLFDFSEIQSHSFQLQPRTFDVAESFDSLLMLHHAPAARKGLEIELEIDDRLPHDVIGDEKRIRQIAKILISNALKFTKKGHISIQLSGTPILGQRWRMFLTVKDTGIGIKPEMLEEIFDQFLQGQTGRQRAFEGSGLGLTLCRKLVQMMDGKITVHSEPGKGSEFQASFVVGHASPETESDPALYTPAQISDLEILGIDDNQVNLMVLQKLLSNKTKSIHVASCAKEGLVAIGKSRPDVVLMDISMPGMDGLEATRLIRSEEVAKGLRPLKVIALSAHVGSEIEADAERAGMDGYLTKPLSQNSLIDCLKQVMGCE